jgi:hypothetical protein
MNYRLHIVIQLICKGTKKTLPAQSGDNLWACMLQGKAYNCNPIECLVQMSCRLQRTKKQKKTWKQGDLVICTCYKGN